MIAGKRGTTITHAFASALAPIEIYEATRVREAMVLLGQADPSALVCVYCDRSAETWDHVEALVRHRQGSGFGHTLGNLVPACRDCNSKRGNKPWAEWMRKRGVAEERIERIRRHHEASSVAAVNPRGLLTSTQATRIEDIQHEILTLMSEADSIIGIAFASGSTGGRPKPSAPAARDEGGIK